MPDRQRRSPRTTTLLSLVLLASLTAACSRESDAVPQAGPPPATPTSTAVTPTTPSAPTTPTPTEEPLDALDWRSPEHLGQPIDLRRYRGGFLGIETRDVARLTADGQDVWRWEAPTGKDVFGSFAGPEVLMVDPYVGRGAHETIALDAATGRELWTQPSSGRTVADDERVYVTTCTGAGAEQTGDCTVSAYDARSGSLGWTAPLGTAVDRVEVVGDSLLVEVSDDAERRSYLVLEAASGAQLDGDLEDGVPEYVAYTLGEDRIATFDYDREPADGCRTTVTVRDDAGDLVWSTQLRVDGGGRGAGAACEEVYAQPAGPDVVVSSIFSPVYVLDGASGELRWRTEPVGLVETATRDLVLLSDEATRETVALDRRTGDELWRADVLGGGWDAGGGYLVTNTDCDGLCDAVVVDAGTGEEVLRLPGVPQVFVGPETRGGRTGLMVRIDDDESYRAAYGFVTLPARD